MTYTETYRGYEIHCGARRVWRVGTNGPEVKWEPVAQTVPLSTGGASLTLRDHRQYACEATAHREALAFARRWVDDKSGSADVRR